jgi:hypothetical protein
MYRLQEEAEEEEAEEAEAEEAGNDNDNDNEADSSGASRCSGRAAAAAEAAAEWSFPEICLLRAPSAMAVSLLSEWMQTRFDCSVLLFKGAAQAAATAAAGGHGMGCGGCSMDSMVMDPLRTVSPHSLIGKSLAALVN